MLSIVRAPRQCATKHKVVVKLDILGAGLIINRVKPALHPNCYTDFGVASCWEVVVLCCC